MKRLIVLLVIMAMLVCICACQKKPVTDSTTPTDTQPTQPTQPTDSRVIEMQRLLEYKDKYDLYNFALLTEFETPEDVNLYSLFAYGFKDESKNPTEQEIELMGSWIRDDKNDLRRLPVEKMNAALTEVFGITLDQTNGVGLDRLWYFEETGCYYGYIYSDENAVVNVRRVEDQDDGTVKVYYRRGRGNYQDMIVTLKPAGESYQIISNVYASPMVGEMQNLLEWKSENRFYNDALTSVYDTPADVDLFMLFYDGFKEESQSPTEQELELLEGKMGQFWKEMDLFRLPTDKMDAVLKELFGITLNETNGVGLDRLVYLEETDCYYMAHSGTHGADLIVSNVVEQEDGSIAVYYSYYLGDFVVRLQLNENGDYQMLSNTILSANYTDNAVISTVRAYFDQRRAYLQGTLSTISGINPSILTDEASHLNAIRSSGAEFLDSQFSIQVNGRWDSHAEATVTEMATFRVNGTEQTETTIHKIQLGLSNTCELIIVCDGYMEETTGFTSCSYVSE